MHVDPRTNLIDLNIIEQIFSQLKSKDILYFTTLNSLVNNLLTNKFHMISPQRQLLGTSPQWIRTKTPPYIELIDKEDYGIVIPFLPSLKNLLHIKEVRENINNPIAQNGSMLQTVLHGSFYKENEFFKQNEKSLGIILYSNELGIANPLGAASKKEKVHMFY